MFYLFQYTFLSMKCKWFFLQKDGWIVLAFLSLTCRPTNFFRKYLNVKEPDAHLTFCSCNERVSEIECSSVIALGKIFYRLFESSSAFS